MTEILKRTWHTKLIALLAVVTVVYQIVVAAEPPNAEKGVTMESNKEDPTEAIGFRLLYYVRFMLITFGRLSAVISTVIDSIISFIGTILRYLVNIPKYLTIGVLDGFVYVTVDVVLNRVVHGLVNAIIWGPHECFNLIINVLPLEAAITAFVSSANIFYGNLFLVVIELSYWTCVILTDIALVLCILIKVCLVNCLQPKDDSSGNSFIDKIKVLWDNFSNLEEQEHYYVALVTLSVTIPFLILGRYFLTTTVLPRVPTLDWTWLSVVSLLTFGTVTASTVWRNCHVCNSFNNIYSYIITTTSQKTDLDKHIQEQEMSSTRHRSNTKIPYKKHDKGKIKKLSRGTLDQSIEEKKKQNKLLAVEKQEENTTKDEEITTLSLNETSDQCLTEMKTDREEHASKIQKGHLRIHEYSSGGESYTRPQDAIMCRDVSKTHNAHHKRSTSIDVSEWSHKTTENDRFAKQSKIEANDYPSEPRETLKKTMIQEVATESGCCREDHVDQKSVPDDDSGKPFTSQKGNLRIYEVSSSNDNQEECAQVSNEPNLQDVEKIRKQNYETDQSTLTHKTVPFVTN